MATANERPSVATLGCGTLVVIALIVLFFARAAVKDVESEVKALRSEVRSLRTDVEAALRALAERSGGGEERPGSEAPEKEK